MIFMNHVVPHLKLIEIIDFASFVNFALLLFLFIGPENIAFRNHRKLKQGIFKSL